MNLTSLGFCRTSCVVIVAKIALLLPELRCKVRERSVTSCTPNSVMLTFSSTTLTVVLAKTALENGENTCQRFVKDNVKGVLILGFSISFKDKYYTLNLDMYTKENDSFTTQRV